MRLPSLLVLLACFCVVFATPAQAGRVQLGWEAPAQADGTPLPDLAEFRLYYGLQSGQYQTMVPVSLATTYTVANLSPGQTYYFSIKAYTTGGIESTFSNEVSATLPLLPPQVELGWEAPAQADGTPLPDLAGFKLYYGLQSGQYQTMVPVGLATTYTVTNLSPGQTYYFSIKAYTTDGIESAFSNEVSATLRSYPSAAAPVSTTTANVVTPSVTTTLGTFLTPASTMTTSQPTTQWSPGMTLPGLSASQASAQTASATGSSETSSVPMPTTTVSQHIRWEMTLESTTTYANPFADVTVRVQYTKAGSAPLTGYGFWDGGSTFKVRQVFPDTGIWRYTTTATDASNSGLHNRTGEVHVVPYTGTNALYRHGLLQVSADQRFLAHADSTPFLWIADTLWGATVWLTEAGFHEAVADRRAKHFTVLQTNFAHKNEVDTAGDTPWHDDRWNVHFMQKLDRMFNDANDQGMYLFVNGLVDLLWDRGITQYERLIEMIGARYAGHYVGFGSTIADPYDPVHEQINAAIRRTAPRTLVAQPHGSAGNGQGNVWTAEQYYDTSLVDYVMDATGAEGDLELACHNAIEGSLRLYNYVPPKPVVNTDTWYEGPTGGTPEIITQLGYLRLLSGNFGYTYSTSLWDAKDADLPAWEAFHGTTYMRYLYDFFVTLDGGRPLLPQHVLIKNQATRYEDRMVLGVSTDGMTYAAFLPKGGTISMDLTALGETTATVTWYDPFTGQYHTQGTVPGGAVHSFVSPFGAKQSALVLMAR